MFAHRSGNGLRLRVDTDPVGHFSEGDGCLAGVRVHRPVGWMRVTAACGRGAGYPKRKGSYMRRHHYRLATTAVAASLIVFLGAQGVMRDQTAAAANVAL